AMVVQITQWLQELQERDDVRVVVLRGAGDKAFCAGHDLKENAQSWRVGGQGGGFVSVALMEVMLKYPKPTIAAVRGYVRQAGVWLSTSCDIIIAAEDANFAITGIARGYFTLQSFMPVVRRIGRSQAVYMNLVGEVIDAHEAKAIGLIDRLVPVGRFEEEVRELAKKLASRDSQAVRAGKEALAVLIDLDTIKALRVAHHASELRSMSVSGEQKAELWEAYIASVRGTGATRRSY
ncbi:MAG: enoyl-CoA hydratase/isomerase family protein, partial [Chloroflexi bacterium]|nr:enoyl-CoA hydratase/isomerase family protein [Chloroflexota bacterium]